MARCFKSTLYPVIKTYSMQTNLTLDDLILQYSENPFAEKETFNESRVTDGNQKKKILSKFLLIAGNLFEKYPESNLNFYKHRYEYK